MKGWENETFDRCSAPQSIRFILEREKRCLTEAKRRVKKLESLLAFRLGQIERGEWPTR